MSGLLARLRAEVPEIAISTDVIVGFPGEAEDQFQRTLDLLAEVRQDPNFAPLRDTPEFKQLLAPR